jgi:type IV pilus assembly protein PilA
MRSVQAKTIRGFSLIELLIVVAIILIIAAIAIPSLLRARIAANESSAANSIRQISRGEFAYNAAYPDTGYASSLAVLSGPDLNCTPSSTNACLIDSSLASGQKSGYNFKVTALLPTGNTNTAFVAGAAPVSFNQTGVRDFCSASDGVLRAQVGASGDAPTSDLTICSGYQAVQ